jgi:hypothetical protein
MLKKTCGPTAAQSPLVPTLDAYLGLEEDERKRSFLDRVQVYMISSHGAYLQHLRSNGRPIRLFVEKMTRMQGPGSPVVSAYNAAVSALKLFRDAHLIIVTLYAIVPSRRAKAMAESHGLNTTPQSAGIEAEVIDHDVQDERSAKDACKNREADTKEEEMNGSPEFLLMKFLKGLRDQTSKAGVN